MGKEGRKRLASEDRGKRLLRGVWLGKENKRTNNEPVEKEEATENKTMESGFSQPGRAMQIQKPAESFTWGGRGWRKERRADAGERAVGSGGNGGIACLVSIFFTKREKDNVLRVSCRGGKQGTSK